MKTAPCKRSVSGSRSHPTSPSGSLTACLSFQVCESVIQSEGVVPVVKIFRQRVEFVGNNVNNNISILLWNITFEDGGQYTCFGINPKEKGKNHSATFELIVVDECEWSSPERSNIPWHTQRSTVTFKPNEGVDHLNVSCLATVTKGGDLPRSSRSL